MGPLFSVISWLARSRASQLAARATGSIWRAAKSGLALLGFAKVTGDAASSAMNSPKPTASERTAGALTIAAAVVLTVVVVLSLQWATAWIKKRA